MLFAYEIAFEKDRANRVMTLSFELGTADFDARFIHEMKQKLLWESLCLIVRRSLEQTPGSIRAVKRLSPTDVQLLGTGMVSEPSDLTDWALREFAADDEEIPSCG